jgi:DNA polymerase-3 subunit beta
MVATMQEGKYPPYDIILRDEKTVKATLSRDSVISALNRVLLSSNLKSNFVRFDFTTDKLTVSTESVEFSKSAKEDIDCTCTAEKFSIGFNGRSVISLLENISDDNIVIGMSQPSKPATISPENQDEGEEYVTVAMPMVLNIV